MSILFNMCTNIVIVQVVKAIPTVLVKKYCYREAFLSQPWFRAIRNNSEDLDLKYGGHTELFGERDFWRQLQSGGINPEGCLCFLTRGNTTTLRCVSGIQLVESKPK